MSQFDLLRQQVEAMKRESGFKRKVEAERLQSIEKLEIIDSRLELLEVTMARVLDTLMLEK